MRRRITVLGVVQGVGLRPFVAGLAEQFGICGTVCNSGGVVRIDAYGDEEAMDTFICRLRACPLPAARVERVLEECPEEGKEGEMAPSAFSIVESEGRNGADVPLIPPDLSICQDCLEEMEDEKDRRYRYPFISCTNCGPRYSILESLPYDRETITMKEYPMCRVCEAEYILAGNRRRHAQTISCHSCGPQLLCTLGENGKEETLEGEQALQEAVKILREGKILALKGIGGYQLSCRIDREDTLLLLRKLKGREKKPFAVMFPNLEHIRECCFVSDAEEALLCGPARPIVLLTPREGSRKAWSGALCSESRFIGAFLPYTGLHRLLTQSAGPLVMTSANLTDDPILTDEEGINELKRRFPGLIGAVAWNTRRIVTPLDDSLMRMTGGKVQMLRRSRGFVPSPIRLEGKQKPVLAFGGDLKAVFALAVKDRVYLSQYFGDMENYRVYQTYLKEMERMQQLLSIAPCRMVCDLHPGYITAQKAEELAGRKGLPLLKVQHHHAHAASVMAEHGLESGIGVIFDGTGYGMDGHTWGGEFLLCRGATFEREGHLGEILLCGGDAVARDAKLAAACHLADMPVPALLREELRERILFVRKARSLRLNTEYSSSMGRLFDAVSALLQIRESNSYEGECAIALENAAWRAKRRMEERRRNEEAGQSGKIRPKEEQGQEEVAEQEATDESFPALDFPIWEEDGVLVADRSALIGKVLDWQDRTAGKEKESAEDLALAFHEAVAQMVLKMCVRIRKKEGENAVLLGGGVFANVLLQERCRQLLEKEGFAVYVNEQVPGNDGGLSLGQAWLAGRLENEEVTECALRCPEG